MIRAKNVFAAPLIAVVLLLVLAAAAQASTIVVNVTDDPAGAGDCINGGQCSLRQAVNVAGVGDTIALQGSANNPVTYTLTQGTSLDIQSDLTILGGGEVPGATIIDGSGNNADNAIATTRIMEVRSEATVQISNVTFTNGIDGDDEAFQSCNPCFTINANGGGALFNNGGTVDLTNDAFLNNGVNTPVGGAISNGSGTLNLTDVSFQGDEAAFGGGLFTRGGTVTANGVTFDGENTSPTNNGAVYLWGGNVSLTNTTIVNSGGASSIGGGVHNARAELTMTNDTLSGNIRGALETDTSGTTRVANTIIGAGFSDGSDFGCVARGRPDDAQNGLESSDAITIDLGNNFDQDGHCGFDGNGDIADADPHLASIADNGGPTRTQALLAGSQAIGNGNPAHCLPTDQRDISRDGLCDIGAFQTHPTSAPATPSTGDAGNITDSSADLHGAINLSGDAGGFHFLWGVTPNLDDLVNSTPIQGAGVVDGDTSEFQTLSGLNPGTTYYYRIVADNSTGSATADTNGSFTTLADAPNVSQESAGDVTDTTADLSFTINPNGDATSYVIKYGDGDPGGDITTEPVPIGAQAGDQQLTATLSNLDPGSNYHFDVIATNDEGQNDFGDQQFVTDQQIQGTARLSLELDDSGQSFNGCPETAHVDWGDGSDPSSVVPDCTPGDEETPSTYSLTVDHMYAEAGHYEIQISYPDIDQTSTQFAQISDNGNPPPSNTVPPAITGTPTPGSQLTCSPGSWTNNPTDFAFAWNRSGAAIANATAARYTVQSADQSHTLTCTVTASNDEGGASAPAMSAGVAVPGAGAASTGGGGGGSTGGSGSSTSKPTPNKPTAATSSPTAAAFGGSVNPGGLATTAHFEYGLDSKYFNPGASGPVYDQQTPSQNVGSDASNHPVSASVSALLPDALYHVRLVAINTDGTTFGPDTTFTTPPAPAPGTPTVAKSFDVKPTQGVVLIEINGKLVPITQLKQIPSGAVIDALHGTLNLITSTGVGDKTQTGTFGGAIFKVTQDHSGLTTLTLVENAFKGAPSYASCKVAHGKASTAALSSKTLQLLRGKDNHGKFRTKGRYAAATTRGTAWTIADRCDGTLTKVTQSSVLVNDLVRHVSVVLHAGQSYLALAKPKKHQ